jgi:hypothetical protein
MALPLYFQEGICGAYLEVSWNICATCDLGSIHLPFPFWEFWFVEVQMPLPLFLFKKVNPWPSLCFLVSFWTLICEQGRSYAGVHNLLHRKHWCKDNSVCSVPCSQMCISKGIQQKQRLQLHMTFLLQNSAEVNDPILFCQYMYYTKGAL